MAVALAACSGSDKNLDAADPNIFPKEYRNEMLLTLTPLLDDPTNIRDAAISDPVLRPAGREPRYSVCVRLNARNANQLYTGVKERIAYFYGGHLNQLVDATEGQCANAAYKPWPELEKYCLAKSCR
jgi:hypothetical protein